MIAHGPDFNVLSEIDKLCYMLSVKPSPVEDLCVVYAGPTYAELTWKQKLADYPLVYYDVNVTCIDNSIVCSSSTAKLLVKIIIMINS